MMTRKRRVQRSACEQFQLFRLWPELLEKIAALRPDLILTTYLATEPADLEKLQQIAPTIGLLGAQVGSRAKR